MQKKAAVYARFSTDKQTESSIVDQRRACAEYAARHGLEVVAHFEDLGISGAALGNRPGVLALERGALAGDFGVVLVADLTRLSRSQGDLPRFIERLRFRRVAVVGVLDGFDSASRSARMQAGLSGLMSDELRAGIRDRVHLALESRAQRAEPTGSKAYGYTSKREIVPVEAVIVREVFARAAAGEPVRAIASSLNARGVPSPGASWQRVSRRADGRWLASALHSILGNDIYIGRQIWNRSQWVKDPDTGKRQRRERPAADWIVHERPELALVDAATWASVQRVRGAAKGRGGGPRYVLSGVLECAECGGKMVVGGSHGGRYYCGNYKAGGVHACPNRLGVLRHVAEARILGQIEADALSPEAVEHALAVMRKNRAAPKATATAPELARLESQAARVRAMVEAGELDASIAEPMLARVESEREALRRAAVPSVARGPLPVEKAYRAAVASLRARIKGKHVSAARDALAGLVGPIRLVDGGGYYLAHFRESAAVALMGNGSGTSAGSGGALWHGVPLALV